MNWKVLGLLSQFKEQQMKIATAISVLQKDADFLGMNFIDFIQFVKDHPLAQTQKTMAAYRVFAAEASALFA